MATFQLLRHRRNEPQAFLYGFDLLELNGTDLRRDYAYSDLFLKAPLDTGDE